MKAETKILLEEYKSKFKTYKEFLDKNDWVNDVFTDNRGTLYSNKLSTEFAIVETVLKSMVKFKEDVGDDISLKIVKDFINSTVTIIKKHISKIDQYEKLNPLYKEGSNPEEELENFNFQTKLFQNKVKSKVALSKLNIDEEELRKKSAELFFGDQKAPLMMRDYLCDKVEIVKNKTDLLGIDFSAAHINPATSNEMLINMKAKDIPPWLPNKHFFEQEKSTIQFWEEEKIKIKNGINIGGYHISGWLYWHTNIFKLNYGAEEEKDIKVALFRDNEYFFDHMYNKAKSKEYGRHGLFLYGTRRYSKSSAMASRLLYGLWTIKNAAATVQGFSKTPDLEALVKYSSDAIGEMHPALKIPVNSLSIDEGIVMGIKEKKVQDRLDFSTLSIINLEGGATKRGGQKTAGSTPDIFLLDEALHEEEEVFLNNKNWIPIKDVKVGDLIGDEKGGLTKVLKKVDVGVVDIYEFTLSDGRKIKSSLDHNWKVYSKITRRYEIKTTKEIVESYRSSINNGFVYNISIPANKAIIKDKKTLGIDPYWLGLYLGDGIKGSSSICTNDKFIEDYCVDYARRLGAECKITTDPIKGNGNFKYIRINEGRKPDSILQNLRKYNTFNTKIIPKEYLDSSIEDRMELLRGLLDSDGYSDKTGRIEFNTSYIPIYEGMKTLLRELGILFKVNIKKTHYIKNNERIEAKDTYRFQIYTYEKVFKLDRKLENIQIRANSRTLKKNRSTIKEVKKLEKSQAYCIQVDNDTSLFITTDYIVTKNCGKGKAIPPWKAAMPSFAGGKGGKWRLVPMLSGCVCAGTKVYDKHGNILNIEDVTKDTGILGYNSSSTSVENIPWIQSPKEKECVNITTDYNKNIKCSKDHPLMVYDTKGNVSFKRAENIKENDKLVFFNGNRPFGNKSIYHSELIGLMIGDGYYGLGTELSISDESLYDYLKIKYYWHFSDKDPDSIEPYYRRVGLKGLTHVLKYHGIYGDTKLDKKLPTDINLWDEESIAGLLRGYFEADGYISKEKNRRRITLTSVSYKLIEQVRDQLEKFGIISNIYTRVRNSKKRLINSSINNKKSIINSSEVCFSLEITRYEFIKKFEEKIGFISNYKKERLLDSVKGYKGKIKKIESSLFKDLLPGKGKYFIGKECTNISFVSVKNIEDIGLQPIYNLTAGVTNTYITNGFISHNTAGEGTLSADAEAMLKDPKAYSILPMDWDHLEAFIDPDLVTWDRNTFGFFVPAQMSLEAPDKIITPFGDFLDLGINTKKLDLEELNKIDISVTDWKAAKEFFEQKRENVKNDLSLLAGETNSFPLTPEDCYVSSEKNKFPGLLAKRRKSFIHENGLEGQKVWLVNNAGNIEVEMTNDPVIDVYPFKGGNFEAPIVIFDNPYNNSPEKPPLGLYCIGYDDVKHNKSDGDSVMSATVFKRSYEGGEWSNRIVAYYDSRPSVKKDYYRNLYLLIKFYNARVLFENEDTGFIDYMEEKHMEDVYLHISDGVGLATEENLNRNKNRKFGWSPSPVNIYNLENTMVMYTKEENVVIGEEHDLTGIDRVNHPMLLEEFYKYKKENNADRIRSFGLALKLARYYDKTYAYMKPRKSFRDEEEDGYKKKKKPVEMRGLTFTKGLTKY